MVSVSKFDAADYLDSEEAIAEYLTACMEDGNPDVLLSALANAAKAYGMTRIAETSGLSRESLYKALGETGNPEFGTVMRIVRALGLTLSARPVAIGHTPKRRRIA